MKISKRNNVLLYALVLVVIVVIPAYVSAYYVPADDDEDPDSYIVYEGEDITGDLEDVLDNDGDYFHIESEGGWRRKIDISFTFDYDLGPFDVFSIYVDVELTDISTVEVWINGDLDGWFLLTSFIFLTY